MPATPKTFYQGALSGTGVDVLYTAGAGVQGLIRSLRLINTSAGSLTVSLWNGAADDAHALLDGVALAAGEWADFDGVLVIEPTISLRAEASGAGVTLSAHGAEVTA
jgi:hypothetical protein